MLRKAQLHAPTHRWPGGPHRAFLLPQPWGPLFRVPPPCAKEISPGVWKHLLPHVRSSSPSHSSQRNNPGVSSAGFLFRSDTLLVTMQATSTVSATYCLNVRLQIKFSKRQMPGPARGGNSSVHQQRLDARCIESSSAEPGLRSSAEPESTRCSKGRCVQG